MVQENQQFYIGDVDKDSDDFEHVHKGLLAYDWSSSFQPRGDRSFFKCLKGSMTMPIKNWRNSMRRNI